MPLFHSWCSWVESARGDWRAGRAAAGVDIFGTDQDNMIAICKLCPWKGSERMECALSCNTTDPRAVLWFGTDSPLLLGSHGLIEADFGERNGTN